MNKFKYVIKLIKATEAKNILDGSSFKRFEKDRTKFTNEVFNAILHERKIKIKEASQIASYYIKSFPITEGIYRYNRLDLALALNHHYEELINAPINELSDLSVTAEQAQAIANALLKDFNPTAIPQDLEAKSKGLTGEFVRYEGKSHTFFMFVEGKRSSQYLALGLDSYYESERFKNLEQLSATEKTAQEATRAAAVRDLNQDTTTSIFDRVEAKRKAKEEAINTPPIEDPVSTSDEEQQNEHTDIHEVEIYVEDYESQSDDYGYEEEVETMDIDDDDWENQIS